MKKQRKNAGFSLIEMMCTLLILVLLVMAIGVGMDAGGKIYKDATFEAESATLAGIMNTTLGDILRYSVKVEKLSQQQQADLGVIDQNFLFTSVDYGIESAYFYIPPNEKGGYRGIMQMKSLKDAEVTLDLMNTGAYPDLVISDLSVVYHERKNPGVEGGYFDISYHIYCESDETKHREVVHIVRLMND